MGSNPVRVTNLTKIPQTIESLRFFVYLNLVVIASFFFLKVTFSWNREGGGYDFLEESFFTYSKNNQFNKKILHFYLQYKIE